MTQATVAVDPEETPTNASGAADRYTVGEIVSKVAAALVGGSLVTYWLGAAIARTVVLTKLLDPAEAVYLAGLVQILVFTGVVIWVVAISSVVRTWATVAIVTGLCVAVCMIGPKTPGRVGRGGEAGPPGAAPGGPEGPLTVRGPRGAGGAGRPGPPASAERPPR